MSSAKSLILWSALASCFVLISPDAAFAQTTVLSSPAEKAQTQQINQNITDANNAANEQYRQNEARYQEQLLQYRASNRNYHEQAARYEAARERYAAQRARYRRGNWPANYQHSIIVETNALLGARVETSNGKSAGHVEEIALASGRVDALRVTLDRNKGDVWIDAADLRFDANKKLVLTDLDNLDLYEMTHETY